MSLLKMLQAEDVDGFNANRGTHRRVELFAEELAGLKLHGVNLQGANLDKSDLTESDLTDANLVSAFLSDIDGTDLVLDGVIGLHVKMKEAWLERCDLTGADLSSGDLSGAVLNESKGEGLRLLKARLKEASAKNALWMLADLSEANLKKSTFTGANLSKAKLTNAKASGSNFDNAVMSGVDATGVRFAGCSLIGVDFHGARLTGASFVESDLTGADLRNADLTRADLSGANLTGAKLNGASLADAYLEGATLDGAEIDGADFTGVDVGNFGFSSDQVDSLQGHGAQYNPDAPLVFDDVQAAFTGGASAVLWTNPDTLETATIRWGVVTPQGQRLFGVLPINANSVMAQSIVAVKEGFALLILLDRPGGVAVTRWTLSLSGELSAPKTTPLGYEPAVLPVFRGVGQAIVMWGLARRGPTLVIHADRNDGEGFQVLSSEPRTTARGFIGRYHPILANKGSVLMTVDHTGVGSPLMAPSTFGGRISGAVPVGDRVFAVWNTRAKVKDPGGLRCQWVGGRSNGDLITLTRFPEVDALDVLPHEDKAYILWTEDEGPDGLHVMVCTSENTTPKEISLKGETPDEIKLIPGREEEEPRVAVSTLSGKLLLFSPSGALLETFSNQNRS